MIKEQKSLLTLDESILNYAKLTEAAGLDGVVCSPLEAKAIHKHIHSDFLTVTPGIRLEKEKTDDQTRIATPEKAAKLGSHYIVVGRPITQAKDPVKAYKNIKKSWQKALSERNK